MTPLEKASQMIVDYQLTFKSLSYEEAVQCSIRTVDDILQELELVCVDEMVQFSNRWKYWEEVKELLEKQSKQMTLRCALLILQSHQKWRMGDELAGATEPKVLTEAINTILQYHIGNTTALIEISDEEIEQEAHIQYPVNLQPNGRTLAGGRYDIDINYSERNAYILSAKWMRDKILNK